MTPAQRRAMWCTFVEDKVAWDGSEEEDWYSWTQPISWEPTLFPYSTSNQVESDMDI